MFAHDPPVPAKCQNVSRNANRPFNRTLAPSGVNKDVENVKKLSGFQRYWNGVLKESPAPGVLLWDGLALQCMLEHGVPSMCVPSMAQDIGLLVVSSSEPTLKQSMA